MRLTIAESDRLGGTGPLEVLLVDLPDEIHRAAEWMPVKAIPMVGDGVQDQPETLVVRVKVLREALEERRRADDGQ